MQFGNPLSLTQAGAASLVWNQLLVNVTGGSYNVWIPVPLGTRTLILSFSIGNASTVTDLWVASGNGLGFGSGGLVQPYYNGKPYLISGYVYNGIGPTNNYSVVVPISPYETDINFIWNWTGSLANVAPVITVIADNVAWIEERLYTGLPNAFTPVNAGVLGTGPARILLLSLSSNAGGSGSINWAGESIILDAVPNLVNSITFGKQGLILPLGEQLTVSADSASIQAGGLYAYP